MRWVAPSWPVLALVIAVVAAGGVLRFNASRTAGHRLSADEHSYGSLAIDVSRGDQYGSANTAAATRWAPGAPVAFGVAARAFGRGRAHQRDELPVARRVQVVLGTLTIVGAFALGTLLAGSIAGLLAAAAIAFYPPLITISHFQLTEPLAALLVLLAVLALVAGRGPPWAAASGALLGLAVLTRTDLLLAPAAAALAVLWAERSRRRAAVLLVSSIVVVAPWTLFVSLNHGRLIPVSEGGQSNLFIGTYLPGHGTLFGVKRALAAQTRRHHPELRHVPAYKLPAGKVLDTVAARHPDRSANSALLLESRHNLRKYALGHPLAYARMTAAKIVRLWWRGYHSPQPVAIAAHLALLAIALAGLVLGLRKRAPAAAVVAGLVLWTTLNNAILVSEPRHNMPLMPALGTVGIAFLVASVLARRGARAMSARPASRTPSVR